MRLEKIRKRKNVPKLLGAFRKALNGIKTGFKWTWTKAKALARALGSWVLRGAKSILAFVKKVLGWVIAGVRWLAGKLKAACVKICRFFRDKKMLLFVIVANAVYIGVCVDMYRVGKPMPAGLFIWPLIISPMWLMAFYAERFFAWCSRGHMVIEKAVSIFFSAFGFLSPALSFYALTNMAKLYFAGSHQWYGFVIIGISILFQGLVVVYYCYELRDVNAVRFTLKFRIQYFLFSVIHLIQVFANIYMLLLILDHGAITGITADSPFALCLDLTFFSAMTFLGRDGLLVPTSEWAKLVVLAESFIFTVYISIVILGLLSGNQANRETEQK